MLQKQVHREAFPTAAFPSSSCVFLQHSQTTYRYTVISLHILDLKAYFARRLNQGICTTHSWLLLLWQNHSSSCTPSQVLLNPGSPQTEAVQPAGKTRLIPAHVYELIPSVTAHNLWPQLTVRTKTVVWELLSVAQLSLHPLHHLAILFTFTSE